MNEDLKIDANSRWVLGAVTNDGNMYIRNARVNPISGALIVEANVTSSNTSIGSTIPGATQGSVFFAGLGGTLAQDNANFFWDDTNNYLGLGTDTPAETLHVVGTAIITGDVGTADQLLGRDSGTGEITGITVGSGLSLAGNTLTATGGGGSGYDTIENEGVAVTQRSTINLTNLLAASDVGGKTQLTIDVANLATDTTFIDDLIANSYFTTNLANDSTFISTLTGNSTFIDDLIANSYFTTNLANDSTFISTLTGNSTFISDVVNIVNTSGSIAIDLSTQVTGVLGVTNGGTGATSHTAYAVICGGTSSGGALQSIASVGTSGQVLTSNGAGALPTFQNATTGGAWTLVATNNISQAVNTATTTTISQFTGLDGDTDDTYMLMLEVASSGSGGSNEQIFLTLNNDTTNNYNTMGLYVQGTPGAVVVGIGTTAWATSAVTLSLTTGGTLTIASPMASEIQIKSTKLVASTTRSVKVDTVQGLPGQQGMVNLTSLWGDTTNNITSIEIKAYQDSGSSRTYTGKVSLYKINR